MKDITDKNFKSNNSEFMSNNSEFMRNKEIELKPCPFCGGKAEVRFVSKELPHILKKYHNRFVFAGCRKCGIVTAIYNAFNKTRSPLKNGANTQRAIKRAIEAWNRRADNEQTATN